MKKAILAAVAAAALVATSVAPQPAEARGGRIAAGVLGGLAAGAILGGAFGPRYYGPGYGYYGPGYGYYGGGYAPAYYGGYAPYYGGGCYVRRERFWDGYGWRVRRVQVCG